MLLGVWDFVLGDEFSLVAPSYLNSLLATPLHPFLFFWHTFAACHVLSLWHQNIILPPKPFYSGNIYIKFPFFSEFSFSSPLAVAREAPGWGAMGKDSKLLGAVGRNRVRENGESPPHPIKNLLFVPSSFILQRSENPLLFWISLILDKIKLSKNSILFMKYVFGFFFVVFFFPVCLWVFVVFCWFLVCCFSFLFYLFLGFVLFCFPGKCKCFHQLKMQPNRSFSHCCLWSFDWFTASSLLFELLT